MSDNRQELLPAILFPGFENTQAHFSVASALREKGYPILAVCAPGDAAALEAARSAGFEAIEAERDEALRAGLRHFNDSMPGLPGIVTVDMAEGYSAEDILHVAGAMRNATDRIVLASRANAPHIGLPPRLERFAARILFAAVHGRSVRDPWAGLRGIPARHVPAILTLKGNGYRYEFNILLNLQHLGIKAASVPVGAAYSLSDGSGFRERALDILRILFLPLKFVSASLVVWVVDYLVYFAFSRFFLPGHEIISLTTSRSMGAITGYVLNRSIVFKRTNNTWIKEFKAATRFALLALFNYGVSLGLLYLFHSTLGINDIIVRMASDILLYVLSYTVQREFIFHRKPADGNSH